MSQFVKLTGAANPFGAISVGIRATPTLGDIDGDGDLDMVVGEGDGLLNYFLNTGTATAPAYLEQTGSANPFDSIRGGFGTTPAFGDIDGDGDLDIVFSNVDGDLVYYRNTGSATLPLYAQQTGTDNPLNGFNVGLESSPTLADIDGDGDLDLVVGEFDGFLNFLQNTGTAVAPAYTLKTGAENPFDGIDVGASSTPTFGDTDGDGDLDMVVGWDEGAEGTLKHYRNTGTATAPGYALETGTASPFDGTGTLSFASPTLADIDADGDLDAVVGERFGNVSYYLNNAQPATPVYSLRTGDANPFNGVDVGFFSTPTLGDIDGDGDLDMVVWEDMGALNSYLKNIGTATAPRYEEVTGDANPFSGVILGRFPAPTLADIDGDGDLDLIVGEFEGPLKYFQNTGNAAEPAYVLQTGELDPFDGIDVADRAKPSFADIDGDGDLDLLVGGERFGLTYYQNLGTATSPVYVQQTGDGDPFAGLTPVGEAAPTFGDIDGDGDLDLIVGNSKGALFHYPNTGTATQPAFSQLTGSGNPFASILVEGFATPAFGDIDGDGQLDLVVGQMNGLLSFYQDTGLAPINEPPTTTPVTLAAIAEDSGTWTITQAMLLANASDEDVAALKAEDLLITGGLGNLADNGNGTWNYTPAPNDFADVSFSYTVTDGSNTVAGSATLDITPVNDAPLAAPDSAQTSRNTGVNVSVLANDSDIDGGVLRVTGVTPGANGNTTVSSDTLSVRYTPNTGFSGFDSFSYTVSDGAGGSATAHVRVVVASSTGSNGNDTRWGTQQADFVLALDGNDRILTQDGADYVDGGRGADTITGGDGADTLLGGEGPDTFLATSAELAGDQIDGGEGTDTLVITNAPASLPANFSFTNLELISFTGALLVQHTALLDLSSLTLAPGSSNSIIGGTANNRITGTASADNITDSAGNDDLRGAGGNDTIVGGFGQDTLHGGTGNDVLYGGSATAPNDFVRDIFVFNTPLNATTNVDQIIGFQATNQDQIQLDTSIFSAITGGATPGLDAGEFALVNGGNAVDGNDLIIFDPLTGNLFYDADGSGLGAKVLFATLVRLTGTLDAPDFAVTSAP